MERRFKMDSRRDTPIMKSASTGNITRDVDKRLDDIECSIKKLELNLKLVDSEDIEEQNFFKLKDEIGDKCKNDVKKTKEFLTSMTTKRYENRLKKIVNYLSFICPVLTIINQTSIPNIINTTELTPAIIRSSLNIFQSYVVNVSNVFQEILDGTTETVDLLDKGLETDLFPLPDDLPTKMTTLSANVLTLADNITDMPGNLVVKLPVIFKYVSKLCSSQNIRIVGSNVSKTLLKKYNLLFFTFCLSMFYILLYSKVRLRVDKDSNIFDMFNTTNSTNLLMQGSGKKGKKSKGTKLKKPKKKV